MEWVQVYNLDRAGVTVQGGARPLPNPYTTFTGRS
jgi:hypothetical protein